MTVAGRGTLRERDANLPKDQFIAVLSHELRTPLTPVLATAAILLQDGDGRRTCRKIWA